MALLAMTYTHLAHPNIAPAYVFPIGVGVMVWLFFGILFSGADWLRRRRPKNRFSCDVGKAA